MKRRQDNTDENGVTSKAVVHQSTIAQTHRKNHDGLGWICVSDPKSCGFLSYFDYFVFIYWAKGLAEVTGSRDYRTVELKRRKVVAKQDPESSPSTFLDSDDSESNASHSSDWDSSESDNESPTELPAEKLAKSGVLRAAEEDIEKLKEEEAVVLGDLDHYWSSQVAAKARIELGEFKTHCGETFSLEATKRKCSDVERLMELPCVLSVGFNKQNSKYTVIVSDRNKALELSEDLANPRIDLVEARNSHLM